MQINGLGYGVVSGVVVALLLFSFTGCAQVLGLEAWQDPQASASGAGGAGTSSSAAGPDVPSTTATGMDAGEGISGPTCADGERNGPETDIDCGGDSCLPCPLMKGCQNDGDCISLKCGVDKTCVERPAKPPCDLPDEANPTCNDCTMNGSETDKDCGGDACGPCPDGKVCGNDADCKSGRCPAVANGLKVCTP